MNDVTWGVPKQRTAKKMEKFDTPVVTMSALVDKGAGRKFSFNKAAQTLLGLVGGESHIKIGFGGDNIYVQSLTEEGDNTFSMTKQCTFSNKRIYEYIAKRSNLTTTEENYLHLTEVEGESYVTVSNISSDSAPESVEEDISTMPTPDTEEVVNETEFVVKEEVVEETTEVEEWD